MKKIILILALAAACTAANAQVKSIAAAESAVQKAKADAENPKKNTKLATWLKYGHALIDAYDAPAGNGLPITTMKSTKEKTSASAIRSTLSVRFPNRLEPNSLNSAVAVHENATPIDINSPK